MGLSWYVKKMYLLGSSKESEWKRLLTMEHRVYRTEDVGNAPNGKFGAEGNSL